MRRILMASSVILLLGAAIAAENQPDRFTKVLNRLVKAINALDHPAIRQDFGKAMKDALPPAKCQAFFEGLRGQYGKITKLDPPRVTQPGTTVSLAHFERGRLDITVVLDSKDRIAGLWFLPHRPAIEVPSKNQTPLRLPFNGPWKVFWGGDTKKLNNHHDVPNQRFAFDLVVVGPDGKTHTGAGTANQDYLAFGKEILAPADGVVTDVIRGVRDNTPGYMNPYSALGNAVFIKHSRYEVSVLAHFKLGSINVKVGDAVKQGQLVGLCGNSGNSSEPHLHYHLQNTPVMQDASGIKCFFQNVAILEHGGPPAGRQYSPVRGDVVAHKPPD